jgi:hypothetical protein
MTNARTLTRDLGGRWHGSYGTARCPAHDDRSPSLSIRDGNTGPLLKCHGGCSSGDVFQALRDRGLISGERRLSLRNDNSVDRSTNFPTGRTFYERSQNCRIDPTNQPAEPYDDIEQRVERALSIWRTARPISGTPAEAYLAGRGIDPDKLFTDPPGWPETLRWHDEQRALIVAVNDGHTGLVRAVQRVFLRLGGSPRRDPDGSKCKRALGPLRGNAARLSCWPDPDGVWGLCEGAESALAARQITGRPCWAAISAGNMPNVAPPHWARHAVVFADNDASGTGLREAAKALHALRALPQIRSARVMSTEVLGTDAADLIEEAADV